jgi:hypothetical protein
VLPRNSNNTDAFAAKEKVINDSLRIGSMHNAFYPTWQPAMINITGFGKNPQNQTFSIKDCAIKHLLA